VRGTDANLVAQRDAEERNGVQVAAHTPVCLMSPLAAAAEHPDEKTWRRSLEKMKRARVPTSTRHASPLTGGRRRARSNSRIAAAPRLRIEGIRVKYAARQRSRNLPLRRKPRWRYPPAALLPPVVSRPRRANIALAAGFGVPPSSALFVAASPGMYHLRAIPASQVRAHCAGTRVRIRAAGCVQQRSPGGSVLRTARVPCRVRRGAVCRMAHAFACISHGQPDAAPSPQQHHGPPKGTTCKRYSTGRGRKRREKGPLERAGRREVYEEGRERGRRQGRHRHAAVHVSRRKTPRHERQCAQRQA